MTQITIDLTKLDYYDLKQLVEFLEEIQLIQEMNEVQDYIDTP